MTPFHPTPTGYEAWWRGTERAVLAGIAREVAAMLRDQAGLPDVDASDPLGPLAATMQSTGTARVPDDPAVQRLLPDASRDDDAVSEEFRHLTQTDLAAAKVRGLERFAELVEAAGDSDELDGFEDDVDVDGLDDEEGGLDEGALLDDDLDDLDDDEELDEGEVSTAVVITHEDAPTVAAALTDLRLVVAQRLGLETDDDVEAIHDDVMSDTVGDDPERGVDAEVRRYWGGIFLAAGLAQESLVGAMLDDLRARRG